eukprot:SAG31_NODE_8991_length_1351_cov_1.366613_1_plen_190_part_00
MCRPLLFRYSGCAQLPAAPCLPYDCCWFAWQAELLSHYPPVVIVFQQPLVCLNTISIVTSIEARATIGHAGRRKFPGAARHALVTVIYFMAFIIGLVNAPMECGIITQDFLIQTSHKRFEISKPAFSSYDVQLSNYGRMPRVGIGSIRCTTAFQIGSNMQAAQRRGLSPICSSGACWRSAGCYSTFSRG